MKKEISLKGKTAIVTGGATGIGFAIASELLDADANVIILGRREEKLKEAAKKLGERCSYYVFDVTDTAHYDELISKIEETTPIDILVNNAGINNKKDYFDFTEEELDRCSFFDLGNEFVIVCGICDIEYVIRTTFPEFVGGFF